VWNETILLAPDLEGLELRRAVRHELCHALDHDEELSERDADLWGGLGDEDARREVFAEACELGPLGAAALSAPCADDPADADGWADAVLERVWWEAPPVVDAPESGLTSWRAGQRVRALFLAPGEDPTELEITWHGGEPGTTRVTVGLSTGAELPTTLGNGPEGAAPPALPSGEDVRDSAGWPDGPAAAQLAIALGYMGEVERRIRWVPDVGWAPDGHCLGSLEQLFTADQTIWSGWAAGTDVVWAPLGPP
jgi:hypothetical protein